jgi:hypothetical protein
LVVRTFQVLPLVSENVAVRPVEPENPPMMITVSPMAPATRHVPTIVEPATAELVSMILAPITGAATYRTTQ